MQMKGAFREEFLKCWNIWNLPYSLSNNIPSLDWGVISRVAVMCAIDLDFPSHVQPVYLVCPSSLQITTMPNHRIAISLRPPVQPPPLLIFLLVVPPS